jgi:ketosteroid isomerase-like protein
MEETDEHKELLNAMNKWITAFEDKDGDAAYKVEKEVIGFGWRTPNFRDRSQVTEAGFKRAIKNINDSIKGWTGSYENLGMRIIGYTGLLCGILTEKITELDGSVSTIRVRYSSTWMKLDGKWKLVMGHRDAQFNNP